MAPLFTFVELCLETCPEAPCVPQKDCIQLGEGDQVIFLSTFWWKRDLRGRPAVFLEFEKPDVRLQYDGCYCGI